MNKTIYDVFLSCKSEDYLKAEPIYHWLVANGHRPFFAPISLKVSKIHGEPVVFGDEIDEALDEADNMIVFTSNAEYVKKGYVKDEWRTYVEELRTGRKSGMLITVLDEVRIEDLPIRLRSVQSFDLSNYKDGILRFLGDTIHTEKTWINHAQIQTGRKAEEERTHFEEEKLTNEKTFTVGGVPFKMIRVEGGQFLMGNSNGLDNERPAHNVTLNGYYIGETVVTEALWRAVMGKEKYRDYLGYNFPVIKVNWEQCQLFIRKLNNLCKNQLPIGYCFALPSEAQWEFAARGGNKSKGYLYSGSNNIDDVAWFNWNTYMINRVKSKQPNELNIYDMSGNVWEWCEDWYASRYYSNSPQNNPLGPSLGKSRVLRGGSCNDDATRCSVTFRFCRKPDEHYVFFNEILGFRLALIHQGQWQTENYLKTLASLLNITLPENSHEKQES